MALWRSVPQVSVFLRHARTHTPRRWLRHLPLSAVLGPPHPNLLYAHTSTDRSVLLEICDGTVSYNRGVATTGTERRQVTQPAAPPNELVPMPLWNASLHMLSFLLPLYSYYQKPGLNCLNERPEKPWHKLVSPSPRAHKGSCLTLIRQVKSVQSRHRQFHNSCNKH